MSVTPGSFLEHKPKNIKGKRGDVKATEKLRHRDNKVQFRQ